MSKNQDNDDSENLYTDAEARRFEELIRNYERIAEISDGRQGEACFDHLVFIINFILTGIDLPEDQPKTTAARRRRIVETLKMNEADAQFLLDICEREKQRRPSWFPDIQQLLALAKQRIDEASTMPSSLLH